MHFITDLKKKNAHHKLLKFKVKFILLGFFFVWPTIQNLEIKVYNH